MLVSIADKQGRIAKRVATMVDDDVAAPLLAELHALAAHKKAAEEERDDLQRRTADKDSDAARLRCVSQWRQTVAANLRRAAACARWAWRHREELAARTYRRSGGTRIPAARSTLLPLPHRRPLILCQVALRLPPGLASG